MSQPASDTTAQRVTALRIIDANFNRACEGLRVVEEAYRLAKEDAFLARQCKELRHELTQALSVLPAAELARARQTDRDVGTAISTPSEHTRESLAGVVAANWKRVEQALRAIEEYGKLAPPLDVSLVEQLRYRTYTVGKAIAVEEAATARLAGARLYVLIDGGGPAGEFGEAAYRERVTVLIAAGTAVIQLRDKTLDDRTLLARARIVRQATADAAALFIMNDRPDLAVTCGADGVHLGQEDLPVHEARRIVGAAALIGVSTHTIEQARQAVLDGADYLGCGPTFPSMTKDFDRFAGLEFLRQVAAEITLPAFAIGGITAENVPQVMETGMQRVAMSGAVWRADHPTSVVKSVFLSMDRDGA